MAASFDDIRREGRADALVRLVLTKRFPMVSAETWCEVFDVSREDVRLAMERLKRPNATASRYGRRADPKHGTLSAYTNHNCRCAECRAAMRQYNRERRARLRLVDAS